MSTKFDKKNCEDGIRLRSGLVLPKWDPCGEYSSDDYLCDEQFEQAFGPPFRSVVFGSNLCEESGKSYDSVKVSTNTDMMSKIDVPSGYGEEAGCYLEKLNGCYDDRFISHDQLHGLVKGFANILSWSSDNVSVKLVKKYCREAYAHSLWKSFLDEEINDRQFVRLMGRTPKYFRGRRWNQ